MSFDETPMIETEIKPIQNRDPSNEDDWRDIAEFWKVRADTTYLNHGSFGITPQPVIAARDQWQQRQDEQPMDFYVRQFEEVWHNARNRLAAFVNTDPGNLVFAENATVAMNIVASSFRLERGDQILLNDHEYGAVQRIWERECRRADSHGANASVVVCRLPQVIEDEQQIIDSVFAGVTDQTKLIIISHITSPTAIIMPVQQICEQAKKRGIPTCIDGPHAPMQVDLDIDNLGCDFYTASCHKWLSAPLGTGFLYVHPKWHEMIQPMTKSWGRLLPALPDRWDEEFIWSGTRNSSGYFSIPTAIDFFNQIGIDNFRQRSNYLRRYAERALLDKFTTEPIARFDHAYASMAHVPLPPGNWENLQLQLWQKHQIEVPIINFDNRWFVRVSCHLYNSTEQIDRLVRAIPA